MRRIPLPLCALAALVAVAGPVAAQPGSYDAEVVYALTGLSGPEAIRVGAAPDSLRPFLPAGAEVIATTDRPGPFGSRSVEVLARLAEAPADAEARYVAPDVAGWSLRPPYVAPDRPMSRVGFASSRSALGPRSIDYDSDSGPPATIAVRFRPRSEGGAFAEVEYRRLYPFESDLRQRSEPESEALEAVLPFLTPPERGRQFRTGGGSSGDSFTSQAILESDLAPAEVSAHYGGLLEAGGWSAGGAASTDDLAISVWTREVDDALAAATFYAQRTQPNVYALRVHVIVTNR